MGYPKRQALSDYEQALAASHPSAPVLVEDEIAPETASAVSRSRPPRLPPTARATDFAEIPEPSNWRDYRTPDTLARFDYIVSLGAQATAVMIVLYLLLLVAVLWLRTA